MIKKPLVDREILPNNPLWPTDTEQTPLAWLNPDISGSFAVHLIIADTFYYVEEIHFATWTNPDIG